VEHNICRLYRLQGVQGEQPCVAGTCADKDDFAFCRSEAVQLRGKFCFGGIEVSLGGERVKTAVEQVFPKAAAVCRAFDFGFDRVAPFAGRGLCKTSALGTVQSNSIAERAENIEIFSIVREAHCAEMCQRRGFCKGLR